MNGKNMHLLLEYAKDGNLDDYIKRKQLENKENQSFLLPEKDVLNIFS